MEGLIPWQPELEDRIEPFYPKAGRGRRPYPLGVMLRVHCVQLFYNVSDPGMEDLLYEVESVRRFCGSAPERFFAGRDDDPELSVTCWRRRAWGWGCSRRSIRIWRLSGIG